MRGEHLLEPFLRGDGLLEAWHSGSEALDPSRLLPFLHVGTRRQARSRGGRTLTRLVLRPSTARRMRDRAEQEWSPRRLRALAGNGFGYAVYLNRHEGVDLDEIETARLDPRVRRQGGSIDAVPDALFRRLVTSAGDSLIVADPMLVVSCEEVSAKGAPWNAASANDRTP